MTTKIWNGSTADWYADSGGDWSPAGDPTSGDDVEINSGEAEVLSGDPAFSVNSIAIGGSGALDIQDPGVTQSIGDGGVTLSSGTGSLQVDASGSGGSWVPTWSPAPGHSL